MTSVKNLAIGLTTVATLGMLTVAAAAEPIGPREDFDPANAEDRAAMHEMMQERHEERLAELEESNPELAAEIRERHEMKKARHEAVKAALESANYEAFIEALGEHAPEEMTEEKFGQLIEIHQLLEDGDKEGAKALAEEYGLERPFGGRGHGRGRHMMKRGMRLGEERPAEAGEQTQQ